MQTANTALLPHIKILLVDDQNLVRMGICGLLELRPHLDVIAQLSDGTEVLDSIKSLQPDILLLDIRMPKMDGIQVLHALQKANVVIPTLMLTTFDEHELVLSCMKAGAKGYLRKDVSLQMLISAVEAVAAGELWVQPAVTYPINTYREAVQQNNASKSFDKSTLQQLYEPLTKGELQVLHLIAAGYSGNEIAEALHKSVGRIRNITSAILAKLQVRDRTRAALKAIELGLI
jgi:DNA-binding NarL/FixJ family response regulator